MAKILQQKITQYCAHELVRYNALYRYCILNVNKKALKIQCCCYIYIVLSVNPYLDALAALCIHFCNCAQDL